MKNKNLESKIKTTSLNQGRLQGAIPVFLVAIYSLFSLQYTQKENQERNISQYIQNLKSYDINQDGNEDLISPTGAIYLQTKENRFVLYEKILDENKVKLDSAYNSKRELAKDIYNKDFKNEN